MAQATRQRTQRRRLDPLDGVARQHELAQRDQIAEPVGGHRGQTVADQRQPLQLMQTGERAGLDRADRAVAQLQTAQTVAEAEEGVRGHAIDSQPADLYPRGPVRQTVQRGQDARLKAVAAVLLRDRVSFRI